MVVYTVVLNNGLIFRGKRGITENLAEGLGERYFRIMEDVMHNGKPCLKQGSRIIVFKSSISYMVKESRK